VRLLVRNRAGQALVEARQHFSDGMVRKRGVLLSEKLKRSDFDDDLCAAYVRAVKEELGSALPENPVVHLLSCPIEPTITKELFSPSYPGLLSRYAFYDAEVDVEGLPQEGSFKTHEVINHKGTLETTWEWREFTQEWEGEGKR